VIERFSPDGDDQPNLSRLVQHAAQLHGVSPRQIVDAVEGKTAASPKEARRGRRAGTVAAVLVMGGLVVAVVIGTIRFLNGPVVAAGGTGKLTPPPSMAPATPATGKLAGLYVTLSYPGAFDTVRRLQSVSVDLEQYMISSKANYRHTIAVEVLPLPSGSLTDDSDYRYRTIHPELYRATSEKIGGDEVVTYGKLDETERTVFWVHGGKLLTVAITTTDGADSVEAFMAVVKPSIRWNS